MTLKNTLATIFLVLTIGSNSCTNSEKKKTNVSPFKKSLIERKVDGTNYLIALPKGYQIKESRGMDFSVYYFLPSDTSVKAPFKGGFYLGNHGAGFGPDSITCKLKDLTSPLLNVEQSWSLYNCNGKYQVETFADSKSDYNWGKMLHVFGRADSDADLKKLLDIYSTLKVSNQAK